MKLITKFKNWLSDAKIQNPVLMAYTIFYVWTWDVNCKHVKGDYVVFFLSFILQSQNPYDVWGLWPSPEITLEYYRKSLRVITGKRCTYIICPKVAQLMGWWPLAMLTAKPLVLPTPIIWWYLKNITSKRNAKVARPSPIPKMKKGPIKSFSRMGAFLETVSDFVLAKHFGACGNSFSIQNGGSPVSQSSIKLSYRTPPVIVIKIRHYIKKTSI